MGGGAQGEVYADVSQAGGDGEAVGLDLRGGGEDGEDGQTKDRPDSFRSLPDGHENHAPADEGGSGQVEGSVELEIDVLRVGEVEWAVAEGGNG